MNFSLAVLHRKFYWIIFFSALVFISHFNPKFKNLDFSFSSVAQSCRTLRPHGLQHTRPPCPSPTPGAYLTHVHRVGDAIQPSHPLSSPTPPAFNLSQHQGLFQWVSSLHQWKNWWMAKVLELQLQHQSFQWIFRTVGFKPNSLTTLQKVFPRFKFPFSECLMSLKFLKSLIEVKVSFW